MLYRSTRILQLNPQLDSALQSLLEHTRHDVPGRHRGDHAAADAATRRTICCAPPPGPGNSVGDDAPDRRSSSTTRCSSARSTERRALLVPGHASGDGRQGCAGRRGAGRFRNAMVAPLIGESRIVGTLVVADRLSDISTFDTDDLKLFETLANHTAVALENGQLEQSLAALSELKEELHHQAFHDSLTGLANRALFSQRVDAPTRADRSPAGVGAGRAVPRPRRLQARQRHAGPCRRRRAARGRRRADPQPIRAAATSRRASAATSSRSWSRTSPTSPASLFIAERLITSFAVLLPVSARHRPRPRQHRSRGGAPPTRRTADDLMRNADVAMYSAKARGKGRIAVFEPHMAVAVATRHQLTASLQRAVTAGEFMLNYQPIVEIVTGTIVGRRGARPLGGSDPRHGLAGRVHPARRGVGRHPAASAAGCSRSRAARPSSGKRASRDRTARGCPSTSRRASSSSRTSWTR